MGKVEGRSLAIGSLRFLTERGIDASALSPEADALRRDRATAVFVAVDGKPAEVLGIADPVKATTPDAVRDLVAEGIRVVMLTGDNRTTAEAVAAKLGIKDVEAEVLPDHKAEAVARLRRDGRVVAMAGDSVNDAPALAAADVGVAMGTGTDVAIESAGVTLLKGDLQGLVRARRLSECLSRRIPDKPTLEKEVAAWQSHRNKHHAKAAKADWQFTTENARVKLKRLYPQFE